jgi:hypothetical protein
MRQGRVEEAKKIQILQRSQNVSHKIARLTKSTRVDWAPCLQEYENRRTERVNNTLVLNREDHELYVLRKDLPCVVYIIKEQITNENIITPFTSHGAWYFDRLVILIGSVYASFLQGCNLLAEVEQNVQLSEMKENTKKDPIYRDEP